jgi:hypothetical protein
MAKDIDLTRLAERTQDSAEPIKRTVQRDSKPNPMQPLLAQSWENRSKREGADSETGATKVVRTYSPDETTALVRALRRASDTLGVGVRIDAPQESYQEDGKDKVRYKAGNVRFEAVTRQKRTRKANGDQASTDAPEQENGDQDSGEDYGDQEQEHEATEPQPEPAWQ